MPPVVNPDKISAVEKAVAVLEAVTTQLRVEVNTLKADLRDRQSDLVELSKTHALLQQRHDEHVRRAEVWGQRWWALVPLLVGAVLSLCSALIVALARK